jgi:membrane protein implicated in regulation of membrane protease activity
MNTFFLIWLTASTFFLLFEIGHPGLFYFISFAGGGICAALASLVLPHALLSQTCVFFIGSALSFQLLRHWIVRNKKYHVHTATNMDALVGQRVLVTKKISRESAGEVKVKSELWLARTHDADILQQGEWVIVKRVLGASVIVCREKI